MAGDFSELDRWVKGLEGMADDLSDPRGVLGFHEVRYLDMAREVGLQTLLVLRPEDKDPDQWWDQARDFVAVVFSHLTSNGIEIFFRGDIEREERKGNAFAREITYADVLEWVKTPPEEGGKDKTAIENNRGREDEQIAYDVHQAILQHRLGFEKKDYGRITERLERFVDERLLGGSLGEFLEAVLEAWANVLGPVMARDMADWVDDAMRW